MQNPKIAAAPGLRWRPRADHLVAYWIARADIVRHGYPVASVRLWPPSTALQASLDDDAQAFIRSECQRLQAEMLAWANAETYGIRFDGTLGGLIRSYQGDPDSGFRELRIESRRVYSIHMRQLDAGKGQRALDGITARDLKRWYAELREAKTLGGSPRTRRAHAMMTMLRILFGYGTAFELDGCARLRGIMHEMRFTKPPHRAEAMTAQQVIDVRRAAHAAGLHSIALAQALQFELPLRQKDAIGEWVPIEEPGVSAVQGYGQKWLYGVRWEEIDRDLILVHKISKSRKGKVGEWDLKLAPMVMEDLAHIPAERRSGPLIVDERTGVPWRWRPFTDAWRKMARAAGVPDHIQNRDSRSGGATEATDAMGDDMESVRHAMTHSDLSTTTLYSRGTLRKTGKVLTMRARHREGGT